VSDGAGVVPPSANPAWELLKRLEQACLAHRIAVPRGGEVTRLWTALALRVGNWRLLAGLHGEVREVLTEPLVARVPMTKPWLRGVANVRGMLLPVSDLQAFLTGELTAEGPRSRILVVQWEKLRVGLLVPELLGFKRLADSGGDRDRPRVDAAIAPYVTHAYEHEGESWPVLNFAALLSAQAFRQAELRLG
jgi:twitching motility protein PilI